MLRDLKRYLIICINKNTRAHESQTICPRNVLRKGAAPADAAVPYGSYDVTRFSRPLTKFKNLRKLLALITSVILHRSM